MSDDPRSARVGTWIGRATSAVWPDQIGLFVLVGLACKNAILIVEFARESKMHGRATIAA